MTAPKAGNIFRIWNWWPAHKTFSLLLLLQCLIKENIISVWFLCFFALFSSVFSFQLGTNWGHWPFQWWTKSHNGREVASIKGKLKIRKAHYFIRNLFLSLLFQKLFLGLTKEVGISNVVTSRGYQVSLSWGSGGANVASQIPRWTQAWSTVRVFGSRET